MRFTQPLLIASFVLCALLALLPTSPAQEAQDAQEGEGAVITVDVEVVNILATVRDKKGRLITDLSKEDFVLEEEGVPQTIHYFSRQTDLPLTLGLLVDTSVSQQRLLGIERQASSQFFSQVLRQKKDLAFLMSFDVDVELLQDLTDSPSLLQRSLEGLQIQGGGGGLHPGPVPSTGRPPGTVMFDAVFLAADELMRPQVGRKALVLISDGNDFGSRLTRDAAIEAAQRSDVVIYSVRYFDREFYFRSGGLGTGGGSTLKDLARETGGAMFEVRKKHPLGDIFDQIQAELRSQYSIGYTPNLETSEGEFRKIKLDVQNRNLKVQARSGYYPKPSRG